MKITQSFEDDKFILEESQTFTLSGGNAFDIELSATDRKKIKIYFDLDEPKSEKELYKSIFKENINGLTIEALELHCSNSNKAYVWFLYSSAGNEKLMISCVRHEGHSHSYSKDKTHYSRSVCFSTVTVSKFVKK